MCSLCRLPVTKNHIFGQILNLGATTPTPFTAEGQIWRARAEPRSTRTRQMSPVVVIQDYEDRYAIYHTTAIL